MSEAVDAVAKIKTVLEEHKAGVESIIQEKLKEQSDASNAIIADLTEKHKKLEEGLANIAKTEGNQKSFGMPGLEYEKSGWSWQRFFLAMSIQQAAGRMPAYPMMSDPWGKCAPFEKEVVDQYCKRRGMEVSFGHVRDFNSDDGSQGGFLVPPEIYSGDIIEATYAQTPMLMLPTMKFTGLRGDLPIPVDTDHLTAYWVSETGKPTKSTGSFTLKTLRPKKLGVFTKMSNRLLAYSNQNIEMLIKDKMSRDASVKLSEGYTIGTGSEHQPLGILAAANRTGMRTATAIGTNGGRFSIDHLMSMKQTLAVNNELRDTNTYGTLMHPSALWGMLRERVTQYTAQAYQRGALLTGALVLDKATIEAASKLMIGDSTQVPATLTKGSNSTCSYVLTGDFSKFATASFREPIFRVSDVAGDGGTGSAFLEDQLYMVMFIEVDSAMLRASAFALLSDAATTESDWS